MIRHCLIGRNLKRDEIHQVYGHPQAVSQCKDLIDKHQWQVNYCSSSADAIAKVKENPGVGAVAIANQFAADLHQLDVIIRDSANSRENYTRFIVIAKRQTVVPQEVPCKISIVFATDQDSGALVSVLTQFKERAITLTKLQSRPIPETPWQELFYADLKGHIDEVPIRQALKAAESLCKFMKILGCYPQAELPKAIIS